MRGGGLHRWMVRQLESAANQAGCWTRVEAFVGRGFVDLVVGHGDQLIAVEVELTAARIPNDITKAESIGATELWIIAPNSTHIDRYRRKTKRSTGSRTRVLVLSQPQALRALARIGEHLDRIE